MNTRLENFYFMQNDSSAFNNRKTLNEVLWIGCIQVNMKVLAYKEKMIQLLIKYRNYCNLMY